MDVTRAVSSKIGSTSFSFLTSAEIHAISVKQITNATLFDNTNLPTAGGLYDPALGPLGKADICQTCSQNSFQCPGHFGHIDLPSCVFHPLFMSHMYNLLRGCCLFCHRFKLPEVQRILYVARLRLLEYGLVSASDDIAHETLARQTSFAPAEAGGSRTGKNAEEGLQAEDGDGELVAAADKGLAAETVPEFRARIEAQVGLAISQALHQGRRRGKGLDGATYAARKQVVAELLKLIIVKRSCTPCGAHNPTLRKDGFIKIVERDLTEREKALHEACGIRRPDVIRAVQLLQAGTTPAPPVNSRMTREGVVEDNSLEGGVDGDGDIMMGENEFARPVDRAELREARKKSKVASQQTRVMPPEECRANLQLLFRNESQLCSLIFGRHGPFESGAAPGTRASGSKLGAQSGNGASADVFFMDVLAVAPTRFRPASVMGDTTFENPQNELLTKIITTSFDVRDSAKQLSLLVNKGPEGVQALELSSGADEETQRHTKNAQRDYVMRLTAANDALMGKVIQLQVDVNSYIDSSKNPTPMAQGRLPPPGVKQALEKKEGLFRKHMMGKRVNYAARSVISPDVNIETNEIGVPPVFAKKLTFPEPVTVHNVALMRQLVINGPDVYPGAIAVRAEDGTETLLAKQTVEQRTALASQLLTPQEHTSRQAKGTFAGLGTSTRTPPANKTVLRHLRDGDILLLNRQPTLHKPSIMAHKARVLVGEKTIRMHYANCNSYNADFDGDEMNMHFPQSQAARAECYNIANTDNQYLVPTSGKPLRGLIQDHVVAGVWMTCKDSLYTREEYQQLLYGALRPEDDYSGGGRVLTLPPAVMRPAPRWTGKQIISTIMLNIKPSNAEGLNMSSKAKVAGRYWGKDHAGEEEVVFSDGELLSGVLDKSQFGATAYGLVHAVYEIYGAETAGKLLSILSRLFTKYLQHNAFTCRMDDLMLSERGDAKRRQLLADGSDEGRKAALRSVGLESEAEGRKADDPDLDFNMRVRLEEVLRDDLKLAALDAEMMSASNNLTSSIIKACIPDGLAKIFPHNNMQMMTVSGAKGSPVNVSQISCLLGPQALEGRRVPVMVSGKTLPSFKPFDTSSRAGGFVSGRFLTGIRPQEYYFHCMAGREGLIDTAVKTSRSGYLQRCLIKHLEGVYVHYDHTVRNSDGSVLQFHYGEDSLDVTKSKYLEEFDFTARNFESFRRRYDPKQLQGVLEEYEAGEHMKKALRKPHKYAPALSAFAPAKHIGSMSEKFAASIEEYVERNPKRLLDDARKKKKSRKSDTGDAAQPAPAELMRSIKERVNPEAFRTMNKILYHRGLVEPGEAVGLLAAQGVGEPSTQMTLNTFHFAGHGAANVTLGIPRLREIVMTASQKIKTPIMRLPVLEGIPEASQRMWCKDASRLLLSQVVDKATVTERISGKTRETDFQRRKTYTIRLELFSPKECKEEYNTATPSILHGLEATFIPTLERGIMSELKRLRRDRARQADEIGHGHQFNDGPAAEGDGDDEPSRGASAGKKGAKAAATPLPAGRPAGADDDDSDEEAGSDDGGDGDADDAKRKRKAGAQASYEEGSSDEETDHEPTTDAESSSEAAFSIRSRTGEDTDATSVTDREDGDSLVGDVDEQVAEVESRLQESSRFVTKFEFDAKNARWAEFSLQLPTSSEKLLLINVVERACLSSVVHEVPNIQRLLIPQAQPGEKPGLTAEGINFPGMWEMGFGVVDMNNIYTNDIGALLHTYGVEAARAAIVGEMAGIFQTYGIDVSMRHLYLIADYQTAAGGFRPFSRGGIADASSPLLKASFEMTMAFLGHAALHGECDPLHGPSANLVVGRPVLSGTGVPQIHQAIAV